MIRRILPLFLVVMLLAGCSLPSSNATPTLSNSDLETQVAKLLTEVPATQAAPSGGSPTLAQGVTVIPTQPVAPANQPSQTALPTVTAQPTQASTTAQATATQAAATQAPTQLAATQAPTQAATNAATATTGPTATVAAATTPIAGDPVSKLGTPTWKDTFANADNWATGEGKFTKITVGSNKLTLTGLSNLDGWRLTAPKIANFYIEATIQTGTCSGSDHYGLIVRVPDMSTANSGYLVGLTCDGKYSLRKWDGTNMTDVIAWTKSDAIKSGSDQTNRLGVLANGSDFTVYINGVAQKSASNDAFKEGNFGFFVGASKTANLTITASQIAYWLNPNLK
jgi:hypothetical protein